MSGLEAGSFLVTVNYHDINMNYNYMVSFIINAVR
jgi:hypothetical protein